MANNQNIIDFIKFHESETQYLIIPEVVMNFSILVKTGQMNNAQPERTTHHVMYCVVYFEAYDNVIKWY